MNRDEKLVKLIEKDIDEILDALLSIDPTMLSGDDLAYYCRVVTGLRAVRYEHGHQGRPYFLKIDELLIKARMATLEAKP